MAFQLKGLAGLDAEIQRCNVRANPADFAARSARISALNAILSEAAS